MSIETTATDTSVAIAPAKKAPRAKKAAPLALAPVGLTLAEWYAGADAPAKGVGPGASTVHVSDAPVNRRSTVTPNVDADTGLVTSLRVLIPGHLDRTIPFNGLRTIEYLYLIFSSVNAEVRGTGNVSNARQMAQNFLPKAAGGAPYWRGRHTGAGLASVTAATLTTDELEAQLSAMLAPAKPVKATGKAPAKKTDAENVAAGRARLEARKARLATEVTA